ncbi:unnamed protein product [Moneuplotes crassus]|uniref:BRO1 domain-containing protein n=1 Tax=Euplotes crassus TaxID=5936 RepID=A0AAD1XL51_EUPCR|nr:unnamed protein product [Moneuplotes crassus]
MTVFPLAKLEFKSWVKIFEKFHKEIYKTNEEGSDPSKAKIGIQPNQSFEKFRTELETMDYLQSCICNNTTIKMDYQYLTSLETLYLQPTQSKTSKSYLEFLRVLKATVKFNSGYSNSINTSFTLHCPFQAQSVTYQDPSVAVTYLTYNLAVILYAKGLLELQALQERTEFPSESLFLRSAKLITYVLSQESSTDPSEVPNTASSGNICRKRQGKLSWCLFRIRFLKMLQLLAQVLDLVTCYCRSSLNGSMAQDRGERERKGREDEIIGFIYIAKELFGLLVEKEEECKTMPSCFRKLVDNIRNWADYLILNTGSELGIKLTPTTKTALKTTSQTHPNLHLIFPKEDPPKSDHKEALRVYEAILKHAQKQALNFQDIASGEDSYLQRAIDPKYKPNLSKRSLVKYRISKFQNRDFIKCYKREAISRINFYTKCFEYYQDHAHKIGQSSQKSEISSKINETKNFLNASKVNITKCIKFKKSIPTIAKEFKSKLTDIYKKRDTLCEKLTKLQIKCIESCVKNGDGLGGSLEDTLLDQQKKFVEKVNTYLQGVFRLYQETIFKDSNFYKTLQANLQKSESAFSKELASFSSSINMSEPSHEQLGSINEEEDEFEEASKEIWDIKEQIEQTLHETCLDRIEDEYLNNHGTSQDKKTVAIQVLKYLPNKDKGNKFKEDIDTAINQSQQREESFGMKLNNLLNQSEHLQKKTSKALTLITIVECFKLIINDKYTEIEDSEDFNDKEMQEFASLFLKLQKIIHWTQDKIKKERSEMVPPEIMMRFSS